jgi:hypothetical protein
VVSREAFADARRIDRAVMRMPADRLEHAALMRGAPHIMPAAMRAVAAPGEFHGAPRGATPASAAAGDLRNEPRAAGRTSPERAVVRGGPAAAGQAARGGERPGQEFGRSEIGYRPAQAERAGSQQFGRPEVGRNPTEGYHGTAQQFGRPQVSQGFRGGAEQFGRPQVAQGFRGGAQQFGRPQAFQTPAASYRGGGMTGRATPQMTARPAAVRPSVGVGGGRHK